MTDRFEKLTTGVSRIYKKIQKIKKHEMNALGLKGTQVMCIYYLASNPGGLTAADLCTKCNEDKAAISRVLAELEIEGFLSYEQEPSCKKYRNKVILTHKGNAYAKQINDTILQITEMSGAGITDKEREIFYRVLMIIADNIDEIERKLSK